MHNEFKVESDAGFTYKSYFEEVPNVKCIIAYLKYCGSNKSLPPGRAHFQFVETWIGSAFVIIKSFSESAPRLTAVLDNAHPQILHEISTESYKNRGTNPSL